MPLADEAVGNPDARVRIYLTLEALDTAPAGEWPVGSTSLMVIPFQLEKGRNVISATLARSTTA